MPKWGGRSRPAAGRGWGQAGGVKLCADKCRAINCEEDAGAGKGPGVAAEWGRAEEAQLARLRI